MKSAHRVLGIVLMLALLATSSACVANDGLIVAGERIGDVALGMRRNEVHELLGKADSSYAFPHHRVEDAWRFTSNKRQDGELHVQFENGVVTNISTTSDRFKTADGLTHDSAIASLPADRTRLHLSEYLVHRSGGAEVKFFDDVKNGIAFEFDAQADHDPVFLLKEISVHARGKPGRSSREDDPRAVMQQAARMK